MPSKPSKHQDHVIAKMKDGWVLRQFIGDDRAWLDPRRSQFRYGSLRMTETINKQTVISMLSKHLIRIKIEGQAVRAFELVPEPN